MSIWEIGTWLAVVVLGPGALAVFVFFLRDARTILQQLGKKDEENNGAI
jgi:hypothetical protein